MGDFKMGNNTVLTQSGTAKPAFGSGAPTGAIVNVLSTTIDTGLDLGSISTGAEVQITGLTVAITPKSTSSKMLLMYNACGSMGTLGAVLNLRLKRDSTSINIHNTSTSRTEVTNAMDGYTNTSGEAEQNLAVVAGTFLDTPTIPSTPVEITYKIFSVNSSGITRNLYINRSTNDGVNGVSLIRATSTLTVMEVAG